MAEKKIVWKIPVRATIMKTVEFDSEVDMDEALELYQSGETVDVLVESIESEEVLDWAE